MPPNRRATDLTPSEKQLIYQFLIHHITNGVVHNGVLAEIDASFGVCKRTIQYVGCPKKGQMMSDVEMMKSIPFEKRGTIRRLAKELNVSKSKVGRWVNVGKRVHESIRV
ncbi:hypothetical protein ACS0TY_002966 [Phlomoides rotata]